MAWNGDISKMGKLADRVADLAEVPSRAAKKVSAKLAEFIDLEFTDGRDPYGDPWAPLSPVTIAMGRTPPPLTDTKAMRKGVRVRPMQGAGVAITVDASYAPPHQTGWSGPQNSGPARPILPDRDVMPPDWEEAIDTIIDREMRK